MECVFLIPLLLVLDLVGLFNGFGIGFYVDRS